MTIKEAMGEFTWTEKGQDDNGAYFILTDSKRGFDYEVMLVKATNDIQVNGAYLKTVPRDIGEFVQMKINQSMIYGKEGEGQGPQPNCPTPGLGREIKKQVAKKVIEKAIEKKATPVKKEEPKKEEKKKEEKKVPVIKKETEADKMKKSKKGKK